jgi:hypothetical protein
MRFDLSTYNNKRSAIKELDSLIEKGAFIELKEVKRTRSNRQNRALHLYFTFISDELTNLGATFCYEGVKGSTIEIPYTSEIVKDFFWRPIQKQLFDTDSTTKLTTDQINTIIDVVNKFFATKGVVISFPSYESLINESEKL